MHVCRVPRALTGVCHTPSQATLAVMVTLSSYAMGTFGSLTLPMMAAFSARLNWKRESLLRPFAIFLCIIQTSSVARSSTSFLHRPPSYPPLVR